MSKRSTNSASQSAPDQSASGTSAAVPGDGPATSATAGPIGYQPNLQEAAAVLHYIERKKARGSAPRFKVQYKNSATNIEPDHPEPGCTQVLVADMMCTGDLEFSSGILNQLATVAGARSNLTANELNFILATVREIGPRDQTEVLLAVQMAAIHNATLLAARRLNHSETIAQQDSNSNSFNKLARTFAVQIEALKRYRSTGEQNVRVTYQHVNVAAGQAVIGIGLGGGGTHESASQSHALGPPQATGAPDARSPAMFGREQAIGLPLPRAGCERPERVPNAWRAGRSAKRKG